MAATTVGVVFATWRVLFTRSGGRAPNSYLTAMGVTIALAAGSLAWAIRADSRTGGERVDPGTAAAGLVDDHGEEAADCRPTRAEREAGARLINDTRAGAARFQSIATAAVEGYRSAFNPPVQTDHYVNFGYATDGKVLDPAHPEALMYTLTSRGPVLVGVMYLTNKSGDPGPEVGGCLTRWHVHDNLCFAPDTMAISGFTSAPGQCAPGLVHLVPPAALHVWFFDVPGGPFATEIDAPYLASRLGP